MSALVLPWSHILYGSLIGSVVGVVALVLLGERQPATLLTVAAGICGGVFAFAAATLLLLATVHRNEPGHRTLKVAGVACLAALIMDIYTW